LRFQDLLEILYQNGMVTPDAAGNGADDFFPEIEVRSLHYDTRNVRPGGLFVAIEGFTTDGHQYVQDAIGKGAVAVIAQKPITASVPVIQVANTRQALAVVSDHFFGRPSRGLTLLSEMLSAHVTHVVLEVSSHAIDLSRINGCRFDIGVFTNLTQDHLDYHGDMKRYWACKKSFFTDHLAAEKDALAVVNTDNAKGRELCADIPYACVTTGLGSENTISVRSVTIGLTGIQGQLLTPQGSLEFTSHLVGDYNLENILSAVGVGSVLDLSAAAIKKGIQRTHSVPGRLERVPGSLNPPVYVDYAHTPDALENVLKALKRLAPNRIISIFGCGGNRDMAKRPLMGNIAARFSDLAIVTSDNPRFENPGDIIDQILVGVQKASPHEYTIQDLKHGFNGGGFCREPDRKRAIQAGILAARPGDIVLIAGKGHETYQIVGEKTIPFDDQVVARSVLSRLTKEGQAKQ